MINLINNKISATFLCIAFSCLALSAQSTVDDLAQSLQTELDSLKSINKELRREYDSLCNLKNNGLPSGYYMRLNGGFVGYDGVTYRIIKDIVGTKVVYSIASFTSADEAFNMASSLRKLNLNEVEVVKIDAVSFLNPQPSRRKISQSMEIID